MAFYRLVALLVICEVDVQQAELLDPFVKLFVCFFIVCLSAQAEVMAAIRLMRAWGAKACGLRIFPEYPFTDLGRMDSWVD